MAHDEALAELARRYFTSRGPATLQDFVWWSGLTTADARAGLKAITADLVRETIDGRTYWMSRSTTPAQNSSPAVHLLPGFDEYLLGYRDRGASLDAAYAKKLNAGGGMLTPTIVADGRVVGTWRRALRKDAVAIKVSPFVPLSEPQWGALKTAAESYGGFVGMPGTIVS